MKNDMGLSQRIPPKYELAGHWHINLKGRALVVTSISAVLVFGLTMILGFIIRGSLRGHFEWQFDLLLFPIVLGVFVALIILHEAVHGVLFLVLGGKPRFGVKLVGRFFPVALYATSRKPFFRNQYLLISLAPFFTLTLVFLVTSILANADGIAALAVVAMAINASGSIGDLLAAWRIRRHGRSVLFEDTEDGFNWYVSSS